MDMLDAVEKVIEERIRPRLADHNGNIEIVSLEEDELTVRFLGQCSGCPSAYLTIEELVKTEIIKAVPQIHQVYLDNGISEDMLSFARTLMSR
ncbi:MAG: NifU family protein [Lachnospiraceae bacterium]|nr:NifU family protein [Lachnospiraceae bacterium]